MIEVTNLKKAYGAVEALRGVSVNVAEGEIVGLLGPNGAGKTTMIKIITGYLQPDEGQVLVDGLDVMSDPLGVQARIGYLPENAPLYPEISVQHYLQMTADLRQVPPDEVRGRLSEAIRAVGIQDYLTRPIGTLSKGYRQRLGLAAAILHRPRLLILDEPTVGLDPTQIIEIRKLIKRLSEHSTILFSTHILPEVEALCDRAIILMNGQVRADASLAELAASTAVIVVLEQVIEDAARLVRGLPEAAAVEVFSTADGFPAMRVESRQQAVLGAQLFKLASQHNWPVREIKYATRTLEAVFNDLAMQPALQE